jgi:hypothetical protein
MNYYGNYGNPVAMAFGGYGAGEKSNFGKETVPSINCSSSVNLTGTTVQGQTYSAGSITAIDAHLRSVNAGGSINLTRCNASEHVDAGGTLYVIQSTAKSLHAGGILTLVESTCVGKSHAGGDVNANRCNQLGEVSTGGSVNISDCPSVNSVSASGHATLSNSKVVGNVDSSSTAAVSNSEIGGTLFCCTDKLVIEDSTIDTIHVRFSQTFTFGDNTGSKYNFVFKGGGAFAMGNGATASYSSGGNAGSKYNIVCNGGNACVIGDGAKIQNVQMFTGQNGSEMIIDGVPLEEYAARQKKQEPSSAEPTKGPKQIIELRGNSKVKNIIFEGKNGEVVCHDSSALSGAITGGIIK